MSIFTILIIVFVLGYFASWGIVAKTAPFERSDESIELETWTKKDQKLNNMFTIIMILCGIATLILVTICGVVALLKIIIG